MKCSTTLSRYIVTCSLMAIGLFARATSYTASQSGNWTDPSIWQAGVAPPATLAGNDFVIINSGLTVNMDQDEVLSNSQAIITVYGSLTGWHSITINSGTLNGNGTIMIHTLRMSAGSTLVFNGALTVDNLYNLQTQLTLQGTVLVADTIGFLAGNVNLGQGSSLTLADNAVLNIGAGTYSNSQSWHQNGRINLYYTRPGTSSMGVETTFVNLHDISVNMPSATDRLDMMGDISVSGALSLLGGRLNMNGHNLTVTGTIASSGTGVLMGSTTSVLTVSGTSATNNVAFAPANNSIANLNVNVASGGALTLSSDLTCLGALSVQAGKLMLGTSHLTLNGAITGAGFLSGTATSGLTLNGSGNVGSLKWDNAGATVGNLTVNVTGTNGGVYMNNDMTVAGALTLSSGYLYLNGKHLTLSGTSAATSGAIYSDSIANISIAGSSATGMGSIRFATVAGKVHDLELNTTNGSWIALGSDVSAYGKLILTSGNLDLGANNLKLIGTDSVSGGSASSYVQTSGAGNLWIKVGASGARMLPIGTTSFYAPLRVRNNAAALASFGANAHNGIYASGTTGVDISASTHGVVASWELQSDMTTGVNAAVEAFWSASMEPNQFNRSKVYLSHNTSGTWDTYTSGNAVAQPNGMYSTSRSGNTTLGSFAVLSSGAPNTTGVKDIADNAAFSVYPNPAINTLSLNIPDGSTENTVTLRDVIGNEVGNYALSANSNKIDISQLTPGVYILSLNEKYSQKIIKQ